MSFLRLRRKGASKVYQAQQSSAPGSQVVQQRLEIDTLKQAPEESVRQKEREWQQERAELLALIKQLNEKLYDQENRHANSIHQVKTDLLIEKGFHASKQSQYLREKAKYEELKQRIDQVKGLTKEKISKVEEFSQHFEQPLSHYTPSKNFDDIYKTELIDLVSEAMLSLHLSDSNRSDIIQGALFLHKEREDLSPKDVIATTLYKISQEEGIISWDLVKQMWPDIDADQIKKLYQGTLLEEFV